MNDLLAVIYLICFAVIAGGAFALMTQSLRGAERQGSVTRRSASRPALRNHPEAPEPGEQLLVLDLSRERLEELYRQAS